MEAEGRESALPCGRERTEEELKELSERLQRGEELSAEEYLQVVRYDSGQVPDVMESGLDSDSFLRPTETFEAFRECSMLPVSVDAVRPTEEWVRAIGAKFLALQSKVEQCRADEEYFTPTDGPLPKVSEWRIWRTFFTDFPSPGGQRRRKEVVDDREDDEGERSAGRGKLRKGEDGEVFHGGKGDGGGGGGEGGGGEKKEEIGDVVVEGEGEGGGGGKRVVGRRRSDVYELKGAGPRAPSTAALLRLSHVQACKVLKKLVNEICLPDEMTQPLTRAQCAWLWALLAVVETPLPADDTPTVRTIARTCVVSRNIAWSRNYPNKLVAAANTVLVAVAIGFGQALPSEI